MAENGAAEKLIEALNEISDAFGDSLKAANDRRHRFATALIEQARENRRDTLELTKKWAEAPFDLFGLFGIVVENTTKAQGRLLDSTRQWFAEISDAQKETRQVIQRVSSANRSATDATVGFARGMFSRAGAAVQTAADGNGRKALKAAAEATETPEAAGPASDPEA